MQRLILQMREMRVVKEKQDEEKKQVVPRGANPVKSCCLGLSLMLFSWWMLLGELWPGLFHVYSPVSNKQTDKPLPKQKDMSLLISHIFSQNTCEFLRPQACCQIRLKLNSELKNHFGEQKDAHISVTSLGNPGASSSSQKTMLVDLGTSVSV